MPEPVQVAWLTGTEELNGQFVSQLRLMHPAIRLIAVSEFPVDGSGWIAYHPKRSLAGNLRTVRRQLRGKAIMHSSLLVVPRIPLWPLRAIAFAVSGTRLAVYDGGLARRSVAGIFPRLASAWLRWHARPESPAMRWSRRMKHPAEAVVPIYAKLAYAAARLRRRDGVRAPFESGQLLSGTAVVIPSRNGLHLLRECLPRIAGAAQIVVVDNGSSDGTSAALPGVDVVTASEPLSFASAINRGLARVRYERVLLLNNDMLAEPGFLQALESAFAKTPDLFCATAQILFPAGMRREETGKAVMRETADVTEFPIRCDVPLPGEDGTWVLYGSGGCSLFDTGKLRMLGGLNEDLSPAYVEDLDLGFRAWQRGWPSVFCASARVEHRHRSTTGRYWTPEQIDQMVQVNYLRFLASAVSSGELFRRLWDRAIRRLHLAQARSVLREAIGIPLRYRPASASGEESVLALTNGDAAVFPGREASGKPLVVIATPYLPFPLSHGGAVRIYNLMRAGAGEFDWVMVAFQERWEPPPVELLDLCVEITLVRRTGSHYRLSTTRPDTVEEFDSATFHAALRQTVRKWSPDIVQLEWTQMAQYAVDCAPAKTVLVEHDVTFDLYEQMVRRAPEDLELADQLRKWTAFETGAWERVDAVVAMSERDRVRVGARGRTIPNGVDTQRYQPSTELPEPNQLLFIGSLAHHPNRSAVEWFLREVWPLLDDLRPVLHVIAGSECSLEEPRVEVEGFVADVRPAYRRAAVVIAPLVESAGTNIKILEALAMGKPVVSTSAGVNGLDVEGVVVADSAQEFAESIRRLLSGVSVPARGRDHYTNYSWEAIAREQSSLYRELHQRGMSF